MKFKDMPPGRRELCTALINACSMLACKVVIDDGTSGFKDNDNFMMDIWQKIHLLHYCEDDALEISAV